MNAERHPFVDIRWVRFVSFEDQIHIENPEHYWMDTHIIPKSEIPKLITFLEDVYENRKTN